MRRRLLATLLGAALCACGAGGGDTPAVQRPAPAALTIGGLPPNADVFDPAPVQAAGDARVWMSYSQVTPTAVDPRFLDVHTRIAFSDDAGASWQDSGATITAAQPAIAPAPDSGRPARWIHEVSRLAHDPQAAGGPWILLWHRYQSAFDTASGRAQGLFQHGWIGLKVAATPAGLASARERKLFAGAGYDSANDGVIGAPEFRLDQLFAGAARLGSCLVFTEPAIRVGPAGIDVALKCQQGPSGKIVALRCDHAFSAGSCAYLGDYLSDGEAASLDPAWSGFSAPEIVATPTADWLIVSPLQGPAHVYRGCLLLRITSFDPATLARGAGLPLVDASIAPSGDFNGACGHVPGLADSGILVGQATFGAPSRFRLWATRRFTPP